MSDEHSDPNSGQPDPADARGDERRRLELQLIKIRSEASAARLEARAAEIELLIRQLGDRTDPAHVEELGAAINPPHHALSASQPVHRFQSWDELALLYGIESAITTPESEAGSYQRVDASVQTVKRPHFLDVDVAEVKRDAVAKVEAEPDSATDRESSPDPTLPFTPVTRGEKVSGQVSVDSVPLDDEDSEQRRRRPAAWLASVFVHAAVLVALALVTLQTQRPKDQVALTATAAEANEVSMETFTIESSEPETDLTDPVPTETEYELSPVGEIAAADFAPVAPPAAPAASRMTSSQLAATAASSLSSESTAAIEFCGVKGGGNHFVYLVDSSGSMGDAFTSARSELLNSIAALKPEQRFYVIFFDSQSDYMRLSDPNRDEPRSVHATPDNRTSLRRWAMSIEMDRGRAPYEALRFALKLRPDVIFLLSDGEFPQGIEDLLRDENKVENLFGDSHPISIVHTIGYHSREGESRMRRIAEQNSGQYRHVPRP